MVQFKPSPYASAETLASFPKKLARASKKKVPALPVQGWAWKPGYKPGKNAFMIVRVYYMSQGDELLAFDSPLLTFDRAESYTKALSQAGEALACSWHVRKNISKAYVQRAPSKREGVLAERWREVGELPERYKAARVVALPSEQLAHQRD